LLWEHRTKASALFFVLAVFSKGGPKRDWLHDDFLLPGLYQASWRTAFCHARIGFFKVAGRR
jgi:hypothetical protein